MATPWAERITARCSHSLYAGIGTFVAVAGALASAGAGNASDGSVLAARLSRLLPCSTVVGLCLSGVVYTLRIDRRRASRRRPRDRSTRTGCHGAFSSLARTLRDRRNRRARNLDSGEQLRTTARARLVPAHPSTAPRLRRRSRRPALCTAASDSTACCHCARLTRCFPSPQFFREDPCTDFTRRSSPSFCSYAARLRSLRPPASFAERSNIKGSRIRARL